VKRVIPALLAGLLVGCGASKPDPHSGHGSDGGKGDGHKGHAGGSASTIHVTTDPAVPAAGQPVTLRLMIHNPGGEVVKDFAVVHGQKVHLIVVREGLDHFAHLHPEVGGDGNLKVAYTFPASGKYLLYADHQPTGKATQVARVEVRVGGEAPAAPALVPNVPGTVAGDGLTAHVALDKGREGVVRFQLKDAHGQAVGDLEPYMGARGHLVVLSGDGREYVHAHPEEGGKASGDTVAFGVHFPGPGVYKGWGQFKRGGAIHTVPFVAKVE
jgi:hypothetical protein